MFDRPKTGERAILVQLALPTHDVTQFLDEFKELASSAKAEILSCLTGTRTKPDAKYYIGQGKALELKALVEDLGAQLVLVNHELTPSQERNLERLLHCRVVDRSGLILDIFAQRARTFEGKLQVELAQLEHLSTRLIRGWTHLERQKGGIGLRGPGETQLETDRRLLRARIKYINQRLDKVQLTRAQNRQARAKANMPLVSIIGYTNAGKSTLFNVLSGSNSYAADKLFATLDPSMRKVALKGAPPVIMADTVGFIRDLPHHLVKAFRATLEEVCDADLLLELVDYSDPHWPEAARSVRAVLHELAVEELPLIQVFNKIDLCFAVDPKVIQSEQGTQVFVSAKKQAGLDLLKEAVASTLFGAYSTERLTLSAEESKKRAALYELGAVVSERVDEQGASLLTVRWTAVQKKEILGDQADLKAS